MLNIRFGTFETNSSSVHSLVLCTSDDYRRLEEGELYIFDEWGGISLLTKEDAVKRILNGKNEYQSCGSSYTFSYLMEMPKSELNRLLVDEEIYSLDQYWGRHEYMEHFEERYTTPGGEEVVAFGYYGQD